MRPTNEIQRQRLLAVLQDHPPRLLRTLSRDLGRNDAYLHQFLYRGTPRRLPEDIRHKLAGLLGVDEANLRDETLNTKPTGDLLTIPFLKIPHKADFNSFMTMRDDDQLGWPFHRAVLQQIYNGNFDHLRLLKIRGNSMQPIFEDGDIVMIDLIDNQPSPPGIFALFDGIGIMAKQLEMIPHATLKHVRISVANSNYSAYQRDINDIKILGRAIWYSRALSR